MEALSLEIEHGVDDVLEHARARDRALLGDMTDEKDRYVVTFRDLEESRGALAQLRHATGRGADHVGGHRLDRVDHGEDRPHLADRLDDRAEVGFAQHVDAAAVDAETARAQLDLCSGLLPRYIKDAAALGQRGGGLHEHRALADPGVAAEQDERTAHDTAAENAIEFAETGREALLGVGRDFVQRDRRTRSARNTTPLGGCDHALLYQCVPAIT